MVLKNVSVFELQSIQIIDCNLAIWLIESKYLKMTKAIQIVEFINDEFFDQFGLLISRKKVELNNIFNSVNFHDLNFSFIQILL